MSRSLKLAKRELKRLGCEVISATQRKIKFQLAHSEWVCTSDTPLSIVRSVVERERLNYRVSSGEYLEAFPVARSWESLAQGDFYVTKHCRERVALMRDQGLANREILAAVLSPETVREYEGKRLYCAGRIAVVVGERVNQKHPLITVLWATDDLWAQNPRPEGDERER